MAADLWPELPDLARRLVSEPGGHGFFQSVRMLEQAFCSTEGGRGTLEGKVRFHPAKEISFPPSDLRQLRRGERDRIEMELTFGGLYGVDAALPHYFLQAAMDGDEAGACTRAFLDVFSHRFYVWLYRAWRKCHPSIDLESPASRYYIYFGALMGDARKVAGRAFQFAGLLGSRTRSVTGLVGLLQESFAIPIKVEQLVPRWVTIARQPPLGTAALGLETVIGSQVLDVSSTVVLRLGPMPFERAQQFLPEGPEGRVLGELIGEYLGPLMNFDVGLVIEGTHGSAPSLGSSGLRLGWHAWLGEAHGEPHEVTISGEDFKQPPRAATETSPSFVPMRAVA